MNEGVTGFCVPETEGQGAQLVQAMVQWGVFLLSPQRRDELATTLAKAGVTATQVHAVAAFVAESEPEPVNHRRYLAALLSDQDRLQRAISDLGSYHQAKADRAVNRTPDANAMTVEPEPWDHDRMCRVAASWVRTGEESLDSAARRLGVHVSTLKAMVDRGRVLTATPPELVGEPKPKKAPVVDADKWVAMTKEAKVADVRKRLKEKP